MIEPHLNCTEPRGSSRQADRLLRPEDRISDLVRVLFLSLLAGTQRFELALYLVDLFVGAVLEVDKLVTSRIDAPKNFIEL